MIFVVLYSEFEIQTLWSTAVLMENIELIFDWKTKAIAKEFEKDKSALVMVEPKSQPIWLWRWKCFIAVQVPAWKHSSKKFNKIKIAIQVGLMSQPMISDEPNESTSFPLKDLFSFRKKLRYFWAKLDRKPWFLTFKHESANHFSNKICGWIVARRIFDPRLQV